MPTERRLFAVVPAAGQSRRMGQPKLLLPLGDKTVIARLLAALGRVEIVASVVVIRPHDRALREEVAKTNAVVVEPSFAPPDMRTSVEQALNEIRTRFAPTIDDGWLLVPADHPVLEASVLDELVARWQSCSHRILVPTHGGRRGHPTFFPWALADEVYALPAGKGLNTLVARHAADVVEMPIDNPAVTADLDTLADYERLRDEFADDAGRDK